MAKKLFLIDGSNHAFRVFHAMPRDMYAAGFPTGALLGFANMLRMLFDGDVPSDAPTLRIDVDALRADHEDYMDGFE